MAGKSEMNGDLIKEFGLNARWIRVLVQWGDGVGFWCSREMERSFGAVGKWSGVLVQWGNGVEYD